MSVDSDNSASLPRACILAISGSDSGGGAGLHADIKAITGLGGFATTAVSALTAQNTHGVRDIMDVPSAFVVAQVSAVLNDMGAAAIKTGMLSGVDVMEAVAPLLDDFGGAVVVDPVMVASSGDRLMRDDGVSALRSLLLRRAGLVTPNLPEAAILTGRDVETVDDMKRAADRLMDDGAHAALIKGGHGGDDTVVDLLALQSGFEVFENERIRPPESSAHGAKHMFHGTGCTLASAIATGLGQGLTMEASVLRGIDFVRAAILAATQSPAIGGGANQPLYPLGC